MTPEAVSQADVEKLAKALLDIQQKTQDDPTRFAIYRDDPYGFFDDGWGIRPWRPEDPDAGGLSPDQCTLIDALVRGETNIVIKSGHSLGKTYILALILLWWLYTRQSKIVTTASTWKQIEKILWVEIKKQWAACRMKLPGEMLQTELRIKDDWFATGLSTESATAFQGYHDPNLLVLVDEAPGVAASIHEAVGSLATDDGNVIIKVGNPTESAGPFYEHFQRGNWCRLHFSPFRHPNILLGRSVIPGAVSEKWLEDKRLEWGEGSPVWKSRVEGEFPDSGIRTIIPRSHVDLAMAPAHMEALREALTGREPVILACDPSRFGDDRTAIAVRRGAVVTECEPVDHHGLMELVGILIAKRKEIGAEVIVVDVVGLGSGVVDRLIEMDEVVLPYHSGSRASEKSIYLNRRAELWFRVRRMLELNQIALPRSEMLAEDLTASVWQMHSAGKIKIESKEDMKRRGVRSPDLADAVLMTFAVDLDLDVEVLEAPRQQDHAVVLEEQAVGGPLGGYGDWC